MLSAMFCPQSRLNIAEVCLQQLKIIAQDVFHYEIPIFFYTVHF